MIVALGVAILAAAAPPAADEELRARVEALAADAMRGRGAGSPELAAASELVRGWLEDAGLEPGAGGWFQEFEGPSGETLRNVVGRIDGRGPECVVVGAHYDGLGVGLPGTSHEGLVLNGADDNASGVAALARIAKALAARGDFERTVLVVAFSGEEAGTLGSKAFTDAPPVPVESIAAMLNLDTIGRVENGRLIVFGTGTAEELSEILQGVNLGFGFDLALNREVGGASDHVPFFAKGIPSLHFFSGAKPEYHGPADDAALLEWEALARVADFVTEVVDHLAADAAPLTFRPAGVERLAGSGSATGRRRVSFGSIPDFSRESGGILLSGVMPGSPAEAAGLGAGDLLIELDGRTLDTIHDFQAALAERAPGDVVRVKYRRGEATREAEVTLRER
jgi:Zn-dependent M28 family amino/carboxypeptidase